MFVLAANGVFSKPSIVDNLDNLPFNISIAEDNPTFNIIAQTLTTESAGVDDRGPDDRWTLGKD